MKTERNSSTGVYGSSKFVDVNGQFMFETTPLKAIKKKCLYDCCAGDTKSYKECNCTSCFLHPFRFGKNPYRKKRAPLSEERKAQMVEKLLAGRAKSLQS